VGRRPDGDLIETNDMSGFEAQFLVGISLPFATGVVGSALGSYGALRFARRIGFMSYPNPIVAQHRRPVAYLGGVGVAAGVFAGVSLGGPVALNATLASAFAFLVLGTLDDLKAFSPGPKFLVQGAAAAVAVALGVMAEPTGCGACDAFISWFFICAMVNAFNFVDVSDGLLASISVATFTGVAIVAPPCAVPAAACAGASLGFLLWNRPPASIFLGDGGSHFLGFMAAALVLNGLSASETSWDWVIFLLILCVPTFELVFITFVRISLGLPWWKGSPDHFALRMQAAGWTRGQVAIAATGVASIFGVLAAVGQANGAVGTGAVALAGLGASTLAWIWLLKMPRGPMSRNAGGSAGETS